MLQQVLPLNIRVLTMNRFRSTCKNVFDLFKRTLCAGIIFDIMIIVGLIYVCFILQIRIPSVRQALVICSTRLSQKLRFLGKRLSVFSNFWVGSGMEDCISFSFNGLISLSYINYYLLIIKSIGLCLNRSLYLTQIKVIYPFLSN